MTDTLAQINENTGFAPEKYRKPKRYCVFRGYHDAPNGGWADFVGSTHDLDGAELAAMGFRETGWCHILDLETGKAWGSARTGDMTWK